MFLLLNHDMSDPQKQDALSIGVNNLIRLPSGLKRIWENIPPDVERLGPLLTPVKEWLEANALKNDYALIQGDFGACWIMVNFAFRLKLIPVYSTTERKAIEVKEKNGSIKTVRQFKHVIFRKYGE